MSQQSPTPSNNYSTAKQQCRPRTPNGIINAIAIQMDRADEAKRRIEKEGLIVRDMKGSVIAHPAIKIEQDANKILCDLLAKNRVL